MKKTLLTILSIMVFAIPTLANADLSTGLVLYFPMDRRDFSTATTMIDRGSGGRLGTLNGSAARANGKIQQALSFPGTSGNGVSFSSLTTGTTFTVSFWLYTGGGADNYSAVFAQDNALGLWYRPSLDKIDYYNGSDNHNNTAMAKNKWHNIVVANNATAVTFYIDGVADGTMTGGSSFGANGFGCDGGNANECFNGRLDEMRYYNRVLSVAEISQLYRFGLSSHF